MSFLLSSCEEDVARLLTKPFIISPIFSYKKEDGLVEQVDLSIIKVNPYFYFDIPEDTIFHVLGDENLFELARNASDLESLRDLEDLLEYADVVSPTPTLSWTPTNSNLVFAAIFKERILVGEFGIKNKNDIVWAWNSGIDTGRDGNVSFYDGRKVVNGEVKYDELPDPLERGKGYVWGVWAWDSKGKYITYSSLELPLIVVW